MCPNPPSQGVCVRVSYIPIHRRREIYCKELAHMIVGALASLRFAGQPSSLEIPAGVDVTVLSPKPVWRQDFLFPPGTSVFSLKDFN